MIISLPFAGLRFAALTRWTQKLANRPRAWSGGYLLGKLLLKRINHLKERELIEIGIPGANPSDPVFAHENSRMRIVEQIAGEVRQLQNDLFGDVGVSLRRGENGEPRRGEKRRYELPRRRRAPRPSHDPRVGCHSQKLVDNRPGGVPGVRSPPSALKPLAARDMKLRVGIGNIYQYIGVDDEH